MTTRAILKGSKLSITELENDLNDFGFEGDELDEVASEIVFEVNRNLPNSLYWMPVFSELWADVEDDTRIDIDEFGTILNEAFEKVAYSK